MNNCIYQVRNSSLTPRLQFDILGRNITEQFLNSRFSSIMDANTAASKNLFCFGIPIYAENDDLRWFTYRDGDNYRICKYDKNSKQSEQSDNLRFAKLFLSLPVADIFIHSESDQHKCLY